MNLFNKMDADGHFGCPKITFGRISGHFRLIRNFIFLGKFFTKWLPSAILDVRKSLSISFLAISDRYAYATLFVLDFFDKMAAIGHFGCAKFTLDHISGHFRSIQILFYFKFLTKWLPVAILDVQKFTFDRISGHFRSIGHFGFPKFTFEHNSGNSILNCFFRRPFWMSQNHFGSHF